MSETLACAVQKGEESRLTASLVALTHANDFITLPENFFYVGRALRVLASGTITIAKITTPGNLDLSFSGGTGAQDIFNIAAMNVTTTIPINTPIPWLIDLTLVCRTVGVSAGTTFFMPTCVFRCGALAGNVSPEVGGVVSLNLPYGTPAAPGLQTGLNNRIQQIMKFAVQFSQATHTMDMDNYIVEVLN